MSQSPPRSQLLRKQALARVQMVRDLSAQHTELALAARKALANGNRAEAERLWIEQAKVDQRLAHAQGCDQS